MNITQDTQQTMKFPNTMTLNIKQGTRKVN